MIRKPAPASKLTASVPRDSLYVDSQVYANLGEPAYLHLLCPLELLPLIDALCGGCDW
jgi:hypothetical protein